MKIQETKLYKLTDSDGCTFKNTQWGKNVTHSATGNIDKPLCSDAWIHAYESPLLAVLLNPIHAAFENPILWEAKGTIVKRNGQMKCGCRTLTTVKQIPLPQITTEQRIKFAILCATAVYKNNDFKTWAENWLNGKDRSKQTAYAAYAARAAAADAARAAAAAARAAARAAAYAAYADAAYADAARVTAADAAYAAYADAAYIDLIAIAKQACK